MIKLVAFLIDGETREFYRATKTIVLDNPEIVINVHQITSLISLYLFKSEWFSACLTTRISTPHQMLGVPKVGQNLVADLALQNPLPEPLENCVFTVQGANLTDGKPIIHE